MNMFSTTTIWVECEQGYFPAYAMSHCGQKVTIDDIKNFFIASSREQIEAWKTVCDVCTAQCVIRNLANADPETVLAVLNNQSNILPSQN